MEVQSVISNTNKSAADRIKQQDKDKAAAILLGLKLLLQNKA